MRRQAQWQGRGFQTFRARGVTEATIGIVGAIRSAKAIICTGRRLLGARSGGAQARPAAVVPAGYYLIALIRVGLIAAIRLGRMTI